MRRPQRPAGEVRGWLVLADALALGVAFGLALLLLLWLRGHRIGPSFAQWWAAEGVNQALAFLLLLVLALVTFAWRGHYHRRQPFWDELLEIIRSLLLAALLNGMVVLLAKWPVSRFLWPVSWGLALVLLPLFLTA